MSQKKKFWGSKKHKASLKRCMTSPYSKTCRKHIYHSKGILINNKSPRNVTMTRRKLLKKKNGKIVSRRKSKQGRYNYYSKKSNLRLYNDNIKAILNNNMMADNDKAPYSPYKEYESYESYKPFSM